MSEGILDMVKTEMYSALPGRFSSYDPATGTATVEVMVLKNYRIEGLKPYPQIENVPVIFPRTKSGGIVFNIESGDTCLLVFSNRDIGTFLENSGSTAPQRPPTRRKFSLSDAIAIPGLIPNPDITEPQGSGTEMTGPKLFLGNPDEMSTPITTTVGVPPAGPIKPTMTMAVPLELIDSIINLATLVSNAGYGVAPAGPTGGGGPIDAQTETALQGLIADLEKLKT